MPDAGTFPSAPGKPIVHNVTDEGAELEWTPPDRHGATPVVGYILQYWSPELGEVIFIQIFLISKNVANRLRSPSASKQVPCHGVLGFSHGQVLKRSALTPRVWVRSRAQKS
jgi:hypothetical protein